MQDVGKVMSDQRYTEDYRREQLDGLFAEARRQLDLIRREAEEKRDTVVTWIDEASAAAESGDPQRELLNLAKQRDAWQRVKIQLNHGVSVDQVVDQAVMNQDLATLVAVQREMPVYRLASDGPATIGMANATSKAERAVADLLKGDRGEAERRRLSLRGQREDVTAALQAGRDHVAAMEADPAETAATAARRIEARRPPLDLQLAGTCLRVRRRARNQPTG